MIGEFRLLDCVYVRMRRNKDKVSRRIVGSEVKNGRNGKAIYIRYALYPFFILAALITLNL
jgi:hypothetical protein